MINSVQILRGVAAWIVVFHHMAQILFQWSFKQDWMLQLAIKAGVGVDIFFVISGFIIYKSITTSKVTPKKFLIYRLARILPAYWLFTIIVACISYVSPGLIFLTNYNPELLFKSLLFIPAMNEPIGWYIPTLTVGWTLNFEMLFYLCVLISLYIFREWFLFGIFFIVVAISNAFPMFGKEYGEFYFYGNGLLYEFLAGMIIGVIYNYGFINKLNYIISIPLMGVSIYMVLTSGDGDRFYSIGVPCALLLLSVISINKYLNDGIVIRKLITLGDWSYSTYLSHVIVLSFLYNLSKKYEFNLYMIVSVSIVTILLFSFLSFTYIEKPFNKIAKLYGKKSIKDIIFT